MKPRNVIALFHALYTAGYLKRHPEAVMVEEIELEGDATSTRLRALRPDECEQVTLQTNEEQSK